MLPVARFRALDAAMQSLRSAGMQLEWHWRDAEIGWVCRGLVDAEVVCELRPSLTPLIGWLELSADKLKKAKTMKSIPAPYRKILDFPIHQTTKKSQYEFELETTAERDLFSEVLEALLPLFETSSETQH
jgi:hypothetical protein